MHEGPLIAAIAALIGDPGRANILMALMDGAAATVSELAGIANIGLSTASAHLAKLEQAGLLVQQKQGRHRYYRLSGPDIAQLLENLTGVAQRTGAQRLRPGPKDAALREARLCYDHLAGTQAVGLMRSFLAQDLLRPGEDGNMLTLTASGHAFFAARGLDMAALGKKRRPLCRACLDWSERKNHLSGALGAAVLDHILAAGWARRAGGRVIAFAPQGAQAMYRHFAAQDGSTVHAP